MKIEELKISVDLARVITKEDIPKDSEITITKVTENETVLNYTRSCVWVLQWNYEFTSISW